MKIYSKSGPKMQLCIFITAVTDWCERRLEKCIVFIMYSYSYKERKEERKKSTTITLTLAVTEG